METTIQVSKTLKENLNKRKLYESETYEDVIWDLLEDAMEVSEETRRDIRRAQKELNEGNGKTLEQIKKELGL